MIKLKHFLRFNIRKFRDNYCAPHRKFSFKIDIFPALIDNYMYLITHNETKFCAAIDPVEPDSIANHIATNNLRLTHILITHHHWDHSSGTENLLSNFPNDQIKVVGFDERIECLNYKVLHNQLLHISDIRVKCLLAPCHTNGHMMYFIDDSENFALFSGDTFFVAGCGKFFEGTANDMYKCVKILVSLPLKTKIYCGHEYTVKNLEFALSIDSENNYINKKLLWAKKQRLLNLPTVPTILEEEIKINPYLQFNKNHYKNLTGKNDPISIIDVIRKMKDCFK